MKKNKKRVFIISGFIILLCIIEYCVASSFNSNANTRMISSDTQGASTADKITQEETQVLDAKVQNIQMEDTEEINIEVATEETSGTEAGTTVKIGSETKASIKSTTAPSITITKMPVATKAPATPPATPPSKVRTSFSEVVAYDGRLRSITCWGDSLTQGTGSESYYPILTNIIVNGVSTNVNGETMPSTLGELTTYDVYNMGVYGEDSRTIACRQGGLKMYVNDITIPASGSVWISQIVCEDGNLVDPNINGSIGEEACFNACSIGGIIGTLSYDWNAGLFIFTRTQAGTELVLSFDTQIITPPSIDRIGDILIIQMGNNGGYDNDYDVLISQYDAMLEYSQCKYYIIVGDTDYSADYRSDWENALKQAYGDHFINMRQYLVDFVNNGGLNDLGIPKEPDDYNQLEIGEVPYSLKVDDESHLNSYGYWIEGNAIYEKGCELGYWGY